MKKILLILLLTIGACAENKIIETIKTTPTPTILPSPIILPTPTTLPDTIIMPTPTSRSLVPIYIIDSTPFPTTVPSPIITITPTPVIIQTPIPSPTTYYLPVIIFVYDDNKKPIDDATLTATMLKEEDLASILRSYQEHGSIIIYEEQKQSIQNATFKNGSTSITTKITNGYTLIDNVPAGMRIKYTVSKKGYTSRELKFSRVTPAGTPSGEDTVAFGDVSGLGGFYGGTNYAISDKPEVTSISPAYNSTGIEPNTSFKLTFGEPMDKSSVEDNFIIITNEDQLNSKAFTVGSYFGEMYKIVYDITNYTTTWNQDNTEVTFMPKIPLPADKDPTKIPQYAISFKGAVKDSTGVASRIIYLDINDGLFRVTSTCKGKVPFKVKPDTTAPKVDNIYIISNTIKLKFNEPMILYPVSGNGSFSHSNLLNPNTYEVSVAADGENYTIIPSAVTNVTVDGADSSNKTLSLITNFNSGTYKGQKLKIKLLLPLSDPAGNEIINDLY